MVGLVLLFNNSNVFPVGHDDLQRKQNVVMN